MRFQGGSEGNQIHFNTISGNHESGADASENAGTEVNAVRNHWGDASGPFHPDDNPSGTGDTITDDVLFDPWLPAPHGTNTWYVDASAPGGGNGAPDTPFTSIQDALDMASRGENIFVLPGTYTENLIISRPDISVYGIDGVVTLDAAGGTGITLEEGAPGATIGNISITNGAIDLQLEADAFLFNSSFDSGRVNFIGDALLSVGYYLDVEIVNVDEKPVAGALLDMTDSQSERRSFITDADGRIDDMTVLKYRRNATGTVQLSPYQLYAFDYDIGYSLTQLDINADTSIILNLTRYGSFGTSIATGDLNGDGFEDIAVGAPTDDQNGEDTGAVFIFFGPPGSGKVLRPIDADLIIHGEGNGSRFGSHLAVGDVNDDDVDELIVSMPDFTRTLTGINGMYYNNDDFTELEYTRIDSTIDFPWGNGDPGGLGNSFSVRWYSSLFVEGEDDYTFFAEIDDTMYLSIDGTRVIERSSYSAQEASSGPVHLEPGYHDIAISFQDTGGDARAIVKWQSSTIAKQIIPEEHFYAHFDTGAPDGGVFVFDGDLFDQGPDSTVSMGDAFLLSSIGEGLGATLALADIDGNGYLDILAGNSLGTEAFYGQHTIDDTIQQATFYGMEQPVLVEVDGGQALAAVMSDEIRVLPIASGEYGLEAFTTVDDFQGTFNFTTFNDGLTIYAYEIVGIMPNGDFNDGWNNWTQAENMRDKNNGVWDLTTEERGDWHVYDGPAAGLGPDQDSLNGGGGGWNGKDCDGLLFSDPFLIPADVKYIDFWHHAKWYTFEVYGDAYQLEPYDDMIVFRLTRASNNETVEEIIYQKPPSSGEEEGHLQFDVSAYAGEYLRFEMEMVTDYSQYDDGIAQIDNITGLKASPNAKGDFISDPMNLSFSMNSLYPHWESELNNGTIEVSFRTNASDEWTPLEQDTFIEFPENENTTFQYRVAFVAAPGESYPVLTELYFNLYGYIPESYGSGTPYNAGAIFGNASLAKVDGTSAVVYNDTTSAITISSDHLIKALASYLDIDRNGVPDLIVSSDDTVYLLPMDGTHGDIELSDAPYSFSGDEGFGSVLLGNLVGSPIEHRGDGRVYVLPTGLNDTAIFGVDIENNSRIYPDTMISLGVTLQNKGLYGMDSVEVTMDITDGDAYSYQDSTMISVGSWETLIVNFDWDVPDVEGANYTLLFSLSPDDENSNNDYSIDLDAHYHALDLVTARDFDVIQPGGILRYGLEVWDLGTFGSDDVTFQADLPLNWDWWVQKDGKNITHLLVEGTGSVELFVRPDTMVLGEYPLEVTTISENGYTTASLDLTAHIVRADLVPMGVRLYREDGKEASLVADDNVTLVLEVGNAGTQDTGIYDVSMEVDGSLHGVMAGDAVQGGGRVNVSFVRAFSEGTHNLTFVVDIDDSVKEYNETNNIFLLQIVVRPGTASSPYLFRIKVVDEFGVNVTKANVTARSGVFKVEGVTDESGNTNLTLTPPYTEGDIYLVEAFSGELYAPARVPVYSEDAMVELVLVVGRYSLSLRCDERDKDIMPGQGQSFTINITNTGDFNDSFTLSLSTLPQNWAAVFSGNGVSGETLYLEEGHTSTVELNLSAWRYAPAFQRYEIILTVSSRTSPYSLKDMKLRASVLLVENITVTTEDPYEHGLPADPISHRVYITNFGNSVRNITLFTTGDTEYSSLNKNKLTLSPGARQEVLFIIIIPNLRDGTILHHQLYGVIAGVGSTPTIDFTTLIDRTSGQYFSAVVEGNALRITNNGNHLEHITITAETGLADIIPVPDSLTIDLKESVLIGLDITMTDLSVPSGSFIPVFISIHNGERYFVNATRQVKVPPVQKVSLSVQSTTLKAIPGTFAEFSVKVQNSGNIGTVVIFSAISSGTEPVIVPSPITLERNKFVNVPLRVRLSLDAVEEVEVTFTATAGESVALLDLIIDPSVIRDFELDELSARTTGDGTRYTINLYNNGDVMERFDITSNCGALDLLVADVPTNNYVQFHLIVIPGQHCQGTIFVNASTAYGGMITSSVSLIPPPYVEIEMLSQLPAITGRPVIFRATGEYPSYSWQIDSRTSQGKELQYTFTAPGTYPVVLTVKDARNVYSVFRLEVVVMNRAPVIVIGTLLYGNAGEYLEFDARDSMDPDGVIMSYTWLIEGRVLEGPVVFHRFMEPGTFDVGLTVTDDLGASNSTTIKVNIRKVGGSDPTEEERKELNTLILGLSLLILLCIIVILLYSIRQLDFEENFLLDKLAGMEQGKETVSGRRMGLSGPPDYSKGSSKGSSKGPSKGVRK